MFTGKGLSDRGSVPGFSLNEFALQLGLREQQDMYSGLADNCFVRIYKLNGNVFLEIYGPGLNQRDRERISLIMENPVVDKVSWLDYGVMVRLKNIILPGAVKSLRQIIGLTASYFSKSYPSEKILRKDVYSCGQLSEVDAFWTTRVLIIRYCEQLRPGFTKNYIRVNFDSGIKSFSEIYVNSYEYGTLELKQGLLEMHRWESDDEARSASFWNKSYPTRIADGTMNDPEMKRNIIKSVSDSLLTKNLSPDDLLLIRDAIEFLG